jgi:hypothetical protein
MMQTMERIKLPCGGTAYFDHGSGISYRCECGATVGSIGMPKHCQEEAEKWDNWKTLGGEGWDYFTEIEERE